MYIYTFSINYIFKICYYLNFISVLLLYKHSKKPFPDTIFVWLLMVGPAWDVKMMHEMMLCSNIAECFHPSCLKNIFTKRLPCFKATKSF